MKKAMTKSLLLFLGLVLPATVSAQDEETSPQTLRILTLGDAPPFTQEVRDGVRYELDPPEGSVPPPKVTLHGVSIEKGPPALFLPLGNPSADLTFVAGEDAKLVLKTEEGEEWLTTSVPTQKKSLLVVWRDSSDDWSKPRHLFLSDDAESDSVRILNLCSRNLGTFFGEQKVKLSPGEPVVLDSPEEEAANFAIVYPDKKGQAKPCLSTRLQKDATLSRQYFIYAADGKTSRIPVKVTALTEYR
jgi:hypothetical protein